VKATNLIGEGDWSSTVSQTQVRSVPIKMQPVTRGSLTTESLIQVDW